MKTIAKILVAIAILNAAGRGGMAAWAYYQFKDGTERLLLFDTGTPLEGLREQIFESAETLGVPLESEDVSLERSGPRTSARVAYTHPVEFFPRYVYPLNLSFNVDAFNAGSLRPGDSR